MELEFSDKLQIYKYDAPNGAKIIFQLLIRILTRLFSTSKFTGLELFILSTDLELFILSTEIINKIIQYK
jgi:hypothetical protein